MKTFIDHFLGNYVLAILVPSNAKRGDRPVDATTATITCCQAARQSESRWISMRIWAARWISESSRSAPPQPPPSPHSPPAFAARAQPHLRPVLIVET